jgi:hypothetical protein
LRRSIVAAVGVLAAVVLSGCSSDDEPEAASPAAPAAAALPGSSATAALPSLPAGVSAAPTGDVGAPAAPGPAVRHATSRPGTTVPAPQGTGAGKPPAGGADPLRSTWVTATVTRGGSGPCYGITTSDGVAWALYADEPLKLMTGTGIRTRVTPGKTPVDCGAGRTGRMGRVQLAE